MTTDDRPRCVATVKRWQGWDTEEGEYLDEPCGRLAKTVVRVGNRDVPSCSVHERKLRRGGAGNLFGRPTRIDAGLAPGIHPVVRRHFVAELLLVAGLER